jgi:hypothetical protein
MKKIDSKLQNLLYEAEKAINELTAVFVEKYYGKEYVEDMYWIGGSIGETLGINDEFWDLNNIMDAVRYDYTQDQLLSWYYSGGDEFERPLNMKHFIKKLYYKGFKNET